MIAYFPAALVALVWIKGWSFFQVEFLGRMALCGLAGLAFYLVLPAVAATHEVAGTTFWQALRLQFATQKNWLLSIPRYLVLLASLTSLLPIFVIAIRWPSTFGDTSTAGAFLTRLMFHVVHAAFLVACLWVTFGAPFSARSLMERLAAESSEAVVPVPFLSFAFLGALCLGYVAGYFLLVFGAEESHSRRRVSSGTRLLHGLVVGLVWLVMVAAPVALVYLNLPRMRLNNGLLLREFAATLAQGLPDRRVVALSDNPQILALNQIWLNERGQSPHLLVDTRLLPFPAYQRSLHSRAPECWPALPASTNLPSILDSGLLLFEVTAVARSNETYYLHPSFGYYFEPLYGQPHQLMQRVTLYQTNEVAPPRLSAEAISRNQQFWASAQPQLDRLVPLVKRKLSDARVVGQWYARALNTWGVELQRNQRLEEAAKCFEQALRLNLSYNQTWRKGAPKRVQLGKAAEDRFGPKFRTWNAILTTGGPLDEPGFLYRLGQLLMQQSLFRQAAVCFLRVADLEPTNVETRVLLGRVYLEVALYERVKELAAALRAQHTNPPLNTEVQIELARQEAMAEFGRGQFDAAEQRFLQARDQFPKADVIHESLVQFYLSQERLTNALNAAEAQLKSAPENDRAQVNIALICLKMELFDQAGVALASVLRRNPNHLQALLTQSALYIQTKLYTNALAVLDRVLKLQPENTAALMNRAIASLQSGQLEAARRDYESLLKVFPTLHSVHYGLGEIAYRQKNFPTAIKYCESYLRYAPEGTTEADAIRDRLKELRGGGR
jgi:tetratricopeptide (TPR) repeat protein